MAIDALARMVLCILHHLLLNQELNEEGGGAVQKNTLILKNDQKVTPIEDMIQYIVQAGYEVKMIKSEVRG